MAKKPSIDSMSVELFNELAEKKQIVCLGYHEDIIPLLTESIKSIKADKVKLTIQQYLNTLNTLS